MAVHAYKDTLFCNTCIINVVQWIAMIGSIKFDAQPIIAYDYKVLTKLVCLLEN